MTVEEDARQKRLKKFQKGLPLDWRQEVIEKGPDVAEKMIRDVAINDVQNAIAQEMDEDLARLKEQVKEAKAGYSEAHKTNQLKLEFLVDYLRSEGRDIPDPEVFLRAAANGGEDG